MPGRHSCMHQAALSSAHSRQSSFHTLIADNCKWGQHAVDGFEKQAVQLAGWTVSPQRLRWLPSFDLWQVLWVYICMPHGSARHTLFVPMSSLPLPWPLWLSFFLLMSPRQLPKLALASKLDEANGSSFWMEHLPFVYIHHLNEQCGVILIGIYLRCTFVQSSSWAGLRFADLDALLNSSS